MTSSSTSSVAYDDSSNNNSANTIEKIKILGGSDKVINTALQFASNAKSKIDACVDHTRPSLMVEIKEVKKAFHDAKKRGVNLRYITEITGENISFCKKLLTIVDELRHLDGIKGNFYLSETEYLAPASLHEKEKPSSQIIYSSTKENVEEQQYIFDTLWSKATSAEDKIKEIEEGVEVGRTDVIQNPQSIQKLFIDMVKSAKHQILLIIPTVNAFLRKQRIGIIELLKQAVMEHGVNVRILTPTNDIVENILKNIITSAKEQQEEKERRNFDLRSINLPFEQIRVSTVTIVVVDQKESLIIEKIDDSKEDFIEAVGLATYSNSKPTVISYISIFESLWKQVELYEQLKVHDKMQKEFINIASHELRTPTQSILGYSELLLGDLRDKKTKDYDIIQAIYRNANRLQKLTQDILDVSRIESQTFKLNNETFNLADIISDAIKDVKRQIIDNKIKMLYKRPNDIYINADKGRINQVVSNLLNNAIKFTSKEGTISITTTEVSDKVDEDKNENKKEIIISVKDTGSGIDPAIMLKLFEKFVTKSDKGTGLGLFISKTIIEAHGGKIWAENNPDSKGATFSFSLPIS